MRKTTKASYIHSEHFNVSVLEYDHEEHGQAVLVRASSKVVLSLGFDLTPDEAIDLAQALTKHANALKAKHAEEQAA